MRLGAKMRQLKFKILCLLLAIFAPVVLASESYYGNFIYKYKDGDTYRVTVKDSKNMKWESIAGSEKGAFGIETPQRFKVNDNVFFVTWVEKSGINVTQVIDLKNMKVYSTIIDGKERYVLEGKVSRER
jgi:phenolic acid decarboxylase